MYATLFLGYTDCDGSIGSFCWARRSKFTPYLPPHSAASRIQLAYQYYVHRVSGHNNPTVPMLFARISFRILRSCRPFDRAVKSVYKKYILWTKTNIDANYIRIGSDYFHRQCDNRHIRMDVESELLRGTLDILTRSYDTR